MSYFGALSTESAISRALLPLSRQKQQQQRFDVATRWRSANKHQRQSHVWQDNGSISTKGVAGGILLSITFCGISRHARHVKSRRQRGKGLNVAATKEETDENRKAPMPSIVPQKSIFLVVFLHLLGFTMGGPILPALRQHFGIEAAQTGLLTSAFPLGMFAAVSIFPALSDVIGRKPVLLASYTGVGVGFVLQGLALHCDMSFSVFLALRVISGAFAGATTVVKAYIADMSDRQSLARSMAYREAAGTLSYIVGPTLGGLLFSFTSLPFVVTFSGLTSLAAAAWVQVFLRNSPKEEPDRSPVVERSAEKDTHKSKSPDVVTPWLAVGTMICVHCLYNFGQAFFDGFFTVLCAERFGWSPAVLGPLLTAMACLVFFNSTLLYPKLVRKMGIVPVAIVGLLSVTAGLSCLGTAHNLSGIVAAMLFYAFGVPHFTPSVPTILARSAPRRQRGFILGIDSAMSAVARILSPALMGMLYGRATASSFRVAGLVVLSGAFLMALQRAVLNNV